MQSRLSRFKLVRILGRPVSWPELAAVALLLAAAPALLFFDPRTIFNAPHGHIARDPAESYRIFSDDVPYLGASRTWDRTRANLFRPHNTHIAPVWRLITWSLMATAGKFAALPSVLSTATYAALVAVMVMTGAVVARETGRIAWGLAAMTVTGTTALMLSPATWYSAGQPLWAAMGILGALLYAQYYCQSGSRLALLLSAGSAALGGWCWTIGHMGGPVAAVYLFLDGRHRARIAAAVPLAGTLLAVGLGFALTDRSIDSRISFHGRTVRQAFDPVRGFTHTCQAIPENLVLGNLGLAAETSDSQGIVLTLGLAALWLARPGSSRFASGERVRLDPLECAGVCLVAGSYLVEWSFRGYLDFRYLRTINPRFIVPWYDIVPQVGFVLAGASWLCPRAGQPAPRSRTRPTRAAALGLLVLAVALIQLHRPRVNELVRKGTPALLPSEAQLYPVERLQMLRSNILIGQECAWQLGYLRKLDLAENLARRLGVSRKALRDVLGHPFIPGSISHLRPELYNNYDAISLLDIPEDGPAPNPRVIVSAFAELLDPGPPPRPDWLLPTDPWPPPDPKGESPGVLTPDNIGRPQLQNAAPPPS